MENQNKVNSSLQAHEIYFQLPLEMDWQPKEDITAYELALCVPYLYRSVKPYEVDTTLNHFRHFKITDKNKNKK